MPHPFTSRANQQAARPLLASVVAMLLAILGAIGVASPALAAGEANLSITVSSSPASVAIGEATTYTVTVANTGIETATGQLVSAELPSGAQYLSTTASTGTPAVSNGVVTWSQVDVPALGRATLNISVTFAEAGTFTMKAQLIGSANVATGSVTVRPPGADLELGLTVGDPTPNVGDQVTFKVTLTNNGPDVASDVSVKVALPAGLTFVSATPTVGTGYDPLEGEWSVGEVSRHTTLNLPIVAQVNNSAPQTVTAEVSASNPADPTPGNNSASVTVTPQQADLAVTTSASHPHPTLGSQVSFTTVLTNNGPNVATRVRLSTPVASNVQLISWTIPVGTSFTSADGTWALDSIAPGAAMSITLTVLPSSLPATHTATIATSDQYDPVSSNNASSATVSPKKINVTLDRESFTYTGAPILPTPVVIDAHTREPLVLGTDYRVAYGPNTSVAGGGIVNVIGEGSYAAIIGHAKFTIAPAPVTVTADSHRVVFGDEVAELTWTVSPKPFGSDALTGELVVAGDGSVGSHRIVQAPGKEFSNPNYAVTFVAGTLDITSKITKPEVAQPSPQKPAVTQPAIAHTGSAPLIAAGAIAGIALLAGIASMLRARRS